MLERSDILSPSYLLNLTDHPLSNDVMLFSVRLDSKKEFEKKIDHKISNIGGLTHSLINLVILEER